MVVIFVMAFALVAAGYWRRGAMLIGIGAGVAAALRLVLSDDRAGLLVVRTKSLDFATMVAFGATLAPTSPPRSTRWDQLARQCRADAHRDVGQR